MDTTFWILIVAVLTDLVIAEPPAWVHLTVWIGRTIGFFERIGLSLKGASVQYIFGAAVSVLLIAGFGLIVNWILSGLDELNPILYLIVGAFILKTTFCLKFNGEMSLLVKKFLDGGDYHQEKADKKIRYLLTTVERDDNEEHAPPIISSTVRSLAENASDFLVAPLFYFLILGVPGAVAYRVSNTLDGMLGHRGEYEYLGKFAACLDDVLNYIPARITGGLFVLAAWISNLNWKKAFSIMLRDHAKTESPNAGWPMAAAAGALEVNLDRAGHYSLGDPLQPLTAAAIGKGVSLFRTMAATDILLTSAILVSWYFLR
ncbi:MAG: adenosylcobinamide-phosphate synthase CbiB [Dehalogenimonas sp.]